MNERLHIYLSELERHFQEIPENRKPILKMLVDYVKLKSEKKNYRHHHLFGWDSRYRLSPIYHPSPGTRGI